MKRTQSCAFSILKIKNFSSDFLQSTNIILSTKYTEYTLDQKSLIKVYLFRDYSNFNLKIPTCNLYNLSISFSSPKRMDVMDRYA